MSTFVPRVHDGYLLGKDTAFTHFNPPLLAGAQHTTTCMPPVQMLPANSSTTREIEVRYYDEVANMVFDEMSKLSAAETDTNNDFREIMLLTDVNCEAGNTVGNAATGGATRHDPRRPWRGTVCEQRLGDGGDRYFIPAKLLDNRGGRTSISLYHHGNQNAGAGGATYAGLKEYSNLYAGKVVGVLGNVIQRDAVSNDIIGVAVSRIICPSVPPPAAPVPPLSLPPAPAPVAGDASQQRIHFVPLPVYNDAQSEQFDLFLKDCIVFLGSRGSSLIVFCGSVAPDEKASEGKSSFDRMSTNAIAHAQRTSEDMNHTVARRIELARQWKQQQQQQQLIAAVPIAFVPHMDDISMTPPVLPQTGAYPLFRASHDYTSTAKNVAEARERAMAGDDDDEEDENDDDQESKTKNNQQQQSSDTKCRIGACTDLASNPAEFTFKNGLRVAATSVDLQSALFSQAVSSQHQPSADRNWRLRMSGRTVRESLLLVPYLSQQQQQGAEEICVEPSSLMHLRRPPKTAPHIYFTPTSIANAQAVFVDGCLFVSCGMKTAYAVRLQAQSKDKRYDAVGLGRDSADKFELLEVDVADSRSFSPDTVRVKVIEFVRKGQDVK